MWKGRKRRRIGVGGMLVWMESMGDRWQERVGVGEVLGKV